MMIKKGDLKIALIHDELTRRGGAEVLFEELIWLLPKADVFALYAGKPQITMAGRKYKVGTSFLQYWPVWFRRHPKRLLPMLAQAAEQFDFSGYDVVISSASGFSKAIVTRAGVPHICYCHTSTRYLWDNSREAVEQALWGTKWLARIMLHYLRLVDYAAAQRVNIFLANSEYTRDRIAKYYRRRSEIVYPPIDTAFFTPHPSPLLGKGEGTSKYFLCVGRLTRTKNFDQAIRVCEKLELKLVIVGRGQDRKRLDKLVGGNTEFMGKVDRDKLRELYRGAQAFLQPGVEDFGIASVEALACGTPVIAVGMGGAKEIIVNRQMGILYEREGDEFLAEALRKFLGGDYDFSREVMQKMTFKFSESRFKDSIYKMVNSAVESR